MDSGAASAEARIVRSAVGESFEIRLWEDRTRGEEWVPLYDASTLVLVSDEYLRTISGNAVDAGPRTFTFRSVKPGMHRLVFEKRLGWKFTPEDRRVCVVQVSDSSEARPHT